MRNHPTLTAQQEERRLVHRAAARRDAVRAACWVAVVIACLVILFLDVSWLMGLSTFLSAGSPPAASNSSAASQQPSGTAVTPFAARHPLSKFAAILFLVFCAVIVFHAV